jgi:predicted double-glycine peptidase
VRKRIRTFYLGIQAILKAAGCYAQDYNIKFEDSEQQEAEALWWKLHTALSEMVELLTESIVKDRDGDALGK